MAHDKHRAALVAAILATLPASRHVSARARLVVWCALAHAMFTAMHATPEPAWRAQCGEAFARATARLAAQFGARHAPALDALSCVWFGCALAHVGTFFDARLDGAALDGARLTRRALDDLARVSSG